LLDKDLIICYNIRGNNEIAIVLSKSRAASHSPSGKEKTMSNNEPTILLSLKSYLHPQHTPFLNTMVQLAQDLHEGFGKISLQFTKPLHSSTLCAEFRWEGAPLADVSINAELDVRTHENPVDREQWEFREFLGELTEFTKNELQRIALLRILAQLRIRENKQHEHMEHLRRIASDMFLKNS